MKRNKPSLISDLDELLTISVTDNDAADEEQQKLQLFEQLIGPYHEVLDSAAGLIELVVSEEIFYSNNTGYDRGFSRWDDPMCRYQYLDGHRPDIHVYVGLFLGAQKEQESRGQTKRGDIGNFIQIQNSVGSRSNAVREMPILELARNILTYLAAKATKSSTCKEDLLRFCVMYGLSGAATNVLEGKYGRKKRKRKAPTSKKTKRDFFLDLNPRVKMPLVGYAALMGHRHVINKLLDFGIDWQQPLEPHEDDPSLKEHLKNQRIGAVALRWAILTKQPNMVKHLTINCGVQFRWLSNIDLTVIFQKLFHLEGQSDEFGPLWLPSTYDRYRYISMSDIRQYRAKLCYQEKQTILKAVIDAGMPRDLFLPAIDVTIDEKAMQEAKDKGMDTPDRKTWKSIELKMTHRERQAREYISEATMSFNGVAKRDKQKTIEEFYNYCLNLWNKRGDKADNQESLLSEYEEADPRWRLKREEGKGIQAFQPWWETIDNDADDNMDSEDEYSDSYEGPVKLVHDGSSEDELSSISSKY